MLEAKTIPMKIGRSDPKTRRLKWIWLISKNQGFSKWLKKHAIVNDNSYCWPLIKYRIQIDRDFSTSFYYIQSYDTHMHQCDKVEGAEIDLYCAKA